MSTDSSRSHPGMPEFTAELRQWRAAHPNATFTEMEQAFDARMRTVRAELLAGEDDPDPRCSDCGGRLIRRGTHTRTVWTQGDEPVALTRSYATCPACGTGLSPPSMSGWDCGRAVS